MSETAFIEQVMTVARQCGWLVHHDFRSARRIERGGQPFYVRSAEPGFPDLVLLHPDWHRLAFVECKDDKAKLRPEQEIWLAGLRAARDYHQEVGFYVGTWRPKHLDAIYKYLSGAAGAEVLPED